MSFRLAGLAGLGNVKNNWQGASYFADGGRAHFVKIYPGLVRLPVENSERH
jgi:hypothetical protein